MNVDKEYHVSMWKKKTGILAENADFLFITVRGGNLLWHSLL